MPSATSPAPRKKRKSAPHQEDFFRTCTETLKSSNRELTEFDAVGINVGKKLAKMDVVQAIYAESLISEVLRKGLLKQLSPQTNLSDRYCATIMGSPTSADSVQSNRSLHTFDYPQDPAREIISPGQSHSNHIATENCDRSAQMRDFYENVGSAFQE